MNVTDRPEWRALAQRRLALDEIRLAALFEDDPERVSRFSFQAGELTADLSRNRIDRGTLQTLVALARAVGLESQRLD